MPMTDREARARLAAFFGELAYRCRREGASADDIERWMHRAWRKLRRELEEEGFYAKK